MAVATYATGLSDITLAETGTFSELTNWAAGTPSTGFETDYFIQGTTCKSSTVKTTQNSLYFDNGSGLTIPTDGAVLTWAVLFAPNSLDTYTNGGIRIAIGSGVGAFKMFYVGGSDQNPNPYGGWRNFAVNPTVETGAQTISVNATNGTFTRSAGDFTTDGFEPGMQIVTTGFTNAGTNTRKIISTVTTTVITVTSTTGLVTETGGGDEWVRLGDAVEGSPTTTRQIYGVCMRLPTTYPSKGAPFGMDAVRYGRCDLRINAGDSGTPANFTDAAAKNDANDVTNGYNRWGLLLNTGASFLWKGLLTIGYSSAAYFSDSNRVINIDDTPHVKKDFTKLAGGNSSTLILSNCTFIATGTRARGQFDFSTGFTAVTLTSCLFKDNDIFSFASGQTIENCSFVRCNEITAGGATFTGCNVLTPTVAADGYSLIWNESTDPDGNLDSMTFSKGTNAHHAIYFGNSIPSSITLRDISFTGFNANNSQNDSTLYFADTEGTITVNLVGCSGNISYKTAGAAIDLVVDPVTLLVQVTDIDTGDPVFEARVLVEVANGDNFPYQESVSMTGTGTTVTVVHSGHGMSTNDYVVTQGALNDDGYNGVHQITVSGIDMYTFTSDETIISSPATGTLVATFAPISGTTDVNGEISDARSYTSPQLITGWVRKGSSAPYYKQQPVTGEISNTAGLTVIAQLIRDE